MFSKMSQNQGKFVIFCKYMGSIWGQNLINVWVSFHFPCSKSLPKTRDQSFPRETFKDNPNPVTKVNQSLSQSMHTLSKPGIIKLVKEDSGEVPVIVDDVTKWISGVNGSTTCQDIIRVILERETVTFQVR